MDPGRKRKIRLIVALTAVVLLAGALVYTSFSASSEARTPSELLASSQRGKSYVVTGKVASSYRQHDGIFFFRVRDRDGSASVPVRYTGSVPDPFRTGREVVVTVHKQGDRYIGESDSLITKCPSKFSADEAA